MQKRPKPQSIPDRYPYICIKFDAEEGEQREDHHMRLPSHLFMARFQKLLKACPDDDFIGEGSLALMGLLIGKSWHHTDWVLTSTAGAHASDEEMGAAVYEELHADGYTFNELMRMYLIIMKACSETLVLSQEVVERAAFFLLKAGSESSSESTAASST